MMTGQNPTHSRGLIQYILSLKVLTRAEEMEMIEELGTYDDTALSTALLEIDRKYNQRSRDTEDYLVQLQQSYEDKMASNKRKYDKQILIIDKALATMVASRQVAIRNANTQEELNAVLEKYDGRIHKTKLDRMELVNDSKTVKSIAYREWQEKKRAILNGQKETKLRMEQERIDTRYAYIEHHKAVVKKWMDIIYEREKKK